MNLENLARLFVPCPGGTEQQRREQRARLLRAALSRRRARQLHL